MDILDAERAVLGACLCNRDACDEAAKELTTQDFSYDTTRTIWEAICECRTDGTPVDRATVYAKLPKNPPVSGLDLFDMENYSPVPGNIRAYLTILRAQSSKRRLSLLLRSAISRVESNEEGALNIAADLSKDMQETLGGPEVNIDAPEPVRTIIVSWMESLRRGPLPVIATPYPSINHYLGGGISPGELAYLGGRRGTGKSAMALEWTITAAKNGHGVMIVSREMLKGVIARRLVSQVSNVSSMELKRGILRDVEWGRVASACGELSTLPIWITTGIVSIEHIEATVASFTEYPLGLLVVDYLQLVRAPKHIRERRLQVEDVSARLKTLALKRNIAILCLSSMRRPEKGDESTEPSLSDFRESGEIEHDGDIVMALHRQPMQQDGSILLWKTRDGETGKVPVRFSGATLRFTEVDSNG